MHEELKFSNRMISKALRISRPVVAEYIHDVKSANLSYQEILKIPDDKLLEILKESKMPKNERYCKLADNFEYYSKELKRTGVTLHLLWEEYISSKPDGYSRSQFCYHYQVWKDTSEISMHIEHKAGDKMFVDFTGKKLSITDRKTGAVADVDVYVAVLGASHLTYVEAVPNQTKEYFITCTQNAFRYFGGVTNAIVPDNLKSAVTKTDRYEPDLNPEYFDFARHYDTTILPARPYHPKDKALVENAVRIVYSWIFAKLRNMVFYSIDDLNKAILDELDRYNKKPMQRPKISRRDMFNEVEKHTLKPLPVEKYEMKHYKRLKVQFNYHIYLSDDKHYYSVPYRYRDKYIELFYTERTIEIYENNIRIAFHRRNRKANDYTSLDEHMPPGHKYMKDWNPQRFMNWAENIGDDAKAIITIVLNIRQHPEQSYKTCLGILSLAKKYGEPRFLKACSRALYYKCYSCKKIENILKNNLENLDTNADLSVPLVYHENLRGDEYYNYLGDNHEQQRND